MIVRNIEGVTPTIDGLLLIDCWEPMEHETKKKIFFYQLADHVRSIQPGLRQIVNASRRLRFDYDNRSILNTIRHYCWDYQFDRDDPNTPNYYNTWILFNAMTEFSGVYFSPSPLKSGVLDSDHSQYIVTLEDFLSHWGGIRSEDRARNWLVVGQSWRLCVHHNSLGLNRLSRVVSGDYGMDFFVDPDFILSEQDQTLTESDFQADELYWEKYLGSNLYRLVKK